jgi:hypothetical protein
MEPIDRESVILRNRCYINTAKPDVSEHVGQSEIIFGRGTNSYMDVGYFYCPYVPLTQTPVVLDPENFHTRKGILTRYGKKLLQANKFYGRIDLDVQNEDSKM